MQGRMASIAWGILFGVSLVLMAGPATELLGQQVISCWNAEGSSISESVGASSNCMPPCSSPNTCMLHTLYATVACDAANGNQSCNYCIRSSYLLKDPDTNMWVFNSSYSGWPTTPPSPIACGKVAFVANPLYQKWCEAPGSWSVIVEMFGKSDCTNLSGTDQHVVAAQTFYDLP